MKKTIFCDAHIHLSHSKELVFSENEQYFCVSSCHSQEEFDSLGASLTRALSLSCAFPFGSGVPPLGSPRSSASLPTGSATATYPCAFISYGIHPQIVTSYFIKNNFSSQLSFLEALCKEKKIIAIGECGFDFFTPDYKASAREQEIVFNEELSLAKKYNLPLVLHLRKSIEKIFTYSKELKKLPAVVFHSFPGTLREAESLKNHGVNAYFSFGKPILNGKKSAIDCLKNLPLENILLETDAPYQTLKGESETFPQDIKRVYEKACQLRNMSLEEFSEALYRNFLAAYSVRTFTASL